MYRKASKGLEAFIDECVRQFIGVRYQPTKFQGMRHRYGTLEAVERLVRGGEVQSGSRKLKALGLLDWSIEAAVIKFSSEFTQATRQCAEFRVNVRNLDCVSPVTKSPEPSSAPHRDQ